jgi:hypothetical protein
VVQPNRKAAGPKEAKPGVETEPTVPLRLAISRGALGLEIY